MAARLGASCVAVAACGEPRAADPDCPVAAMGCACTQGGSCDAGLVCTNGLCVGDDATDATGTPTTTPTSSDPTAESTADATSMTTDGPKLDVGSDTSGGTCEKTGCAQVDLLFALDSSLSMSEEIGALASGAAFADIVFALANLNCGGIDYRVGLTNDNDGGFLGGGADPWFDSATMSAADITVGFSQAASNVLGNGGTALGCEHVLSSAFDLLATDTTGFVREDALLVVVLVTDVDDFGEYDQLGWPTCTCPFGVCDQLCTTSGRAVDDIYADLLALKGGDPAALATIVVAGDPGVTEGMNMCGQPASCCGVGIECGQAHHATRLWDFAALHGANGVTADICDGAEMVPVAIQNALGSQIDLACQTFEPAG